MAMPDLGDALLDRMIRTLVAEADPEQVILFGSRARGDARPDSDVDLLVVESEPFGAGRCRHAETVRLCQALPATPVARDILVYSRDEIERWRGSLNHVAARALREGRVLYAKDRGGPAPASPPSGVRDAGGARGRYAWPAPAADRPSGVRETRADCRSEPRPCAPSADRPSGVRDGGPPRSDVDQARLLLGMADDDLDAFRAMRNPAEFSDEIFGFHVQQAAEKCCKAWIALLGEEYPLTHDVGELIARIRERDGAVSAFAGLAGFTPFAVRFRYERLPETAAPIDRPAAVRQVEALRWRVRDLLPPPA